MANNCAFDMRITGGEEEIKELISMLQWKGKFENAGLGRVYSFDAEEIEETGTPGVFQVNGYGDCAWSVLTAMQNYNGRNPSLESETGRLGLVVELYSSEPGVGFQEHVLIAKGNVIKSECVDYAEHWVEGVEGLEAYNKENDTNFTPDMVNCNGDVCIGGFGDAYGEFEDVSEYFLPTKEKTQRSIDDQIKSASDLRENVPSADNAALKFTERF